MADVVEPSSKKLRLDESKGEPKECAAEESSKSQTNPHTKVTHVDNHPSKPDKIENDLHVSEHVCETDVGITEYISNHDGFHGIIKQRFSDFLVNEISLNGQVVTLTDIEEPAGDKVKEEEDSAVDEILTEEQRTALRDMVDSETPDGEYIIPVGEDKKQRGQIHEAIRKHFSGLESSTSEKDGKKIILVKKQIACAAKGKKNNKRSAHNRSSPWPHSGTDYCHFCLYKENMDTMEAVNILSRYLNLKPNMVTYAGTKDKRAKTCQMACVYRIMATKLHSINKHLRGITLGNFSYNKDSLRLGDLKGNRFIIVLRSVTGSDSQITQAMESLRTIGFINYFGMQRFGTSSVPTHLVGRALLRSAWQEAIELILQPRHGEKNKVSSARISWWENRDAAKALELIGNRHCPERFLLNGLKKRAENDLVGAIGFIPRNQRTMYIHAYQSCVWNILVSRRIRQHGLKPVIGDLAIRHQQLWERQGNDDGTDKRSFVHPSYVTEADLASVKIQDIVMPLPGYDILLPQNDMAQWYEEILAEDGFSLADLKHKVKDYALRGQYRHIVVQPRELDYETINYQDPFEPLVLSDLEKMKEQKLKQAEKDAPLKAVKLSFSLPSSTYATMAVREVLKQDTSAANQSKLTAANGEMLAERNANSTETAKVICTDSDSVSIEDDMDTVETNVS